MRFKMGGIYPAILTPFTKNGKQVDYDKACAYAHYLADKGVHGIFVGGTSGEALLMSMDERKRLTEELVGAVGKRIEVVVQSGTIDTYSTIELTEHSMASGAKAVGIYTPSIYRLDGSANYNHFKMIAEASPKSPILLYNIPSVTNNNLSPDLIMQLANDFDNVVGMKDSSGNMGHVARVVAKTPKSFIVINGADDFTYQAYMTGCQGSVAITANVAPEIFLKIYKEQKAGNFKAALKASEHLTRVIDGIGGGSPLSVYKEAVRLRGADAGYVRPPQREATKDEKKKVKTALKREKLIK